MSAAANSASPEPLELEIYSIPFRLRAPRAEHDRLQRAANRVDTVMRELVTAQPSADTTRLAIQAAFLICCDYFRTMDENFAEGGDSNKVVERVDDILKGLEIALSRMNKALEAGQEEPPPPAPKKKKSAAPPVQEPAPPAGAEPEAGAEVNAEAPQEPADEK